METELVPSGRTVNLAGYAAQVWEIRPDYSRASEAELSQLSQAGDRTAALELADRWDRGTLTTANLLLSGDLTLRGKCLRGRAAVMIDTTTGKLV